MNIHLKGLIDIIRLATEDFVEIFLCLNSPDKDTIITKF